MWQDGAICGRKILQKAERRIWDDTEGRIQRQETRRKNPECRISVKKVVKKKPTTRVGVCWFWFRLVKQNPAACIGDDHADYGDQSVLQRRRGAKQLRVAYSEDQTDGKKERSIYYINLFYLHYHTSL